MDCISENFTLKEKDIQTLKYVLCQQRMYIYIDNAFVITNNYILKILKLSCFINNILTGSKVNKNSTHTHNVHFFLNIFGMKINFLCHSPFVKKKFPLN